MITAAVAKKRLASSKKADATVQTSLNKRPRQEVELACEAPRSQKHVKKLAKKGELEIHVISSQTTEATNPDVPLAAPVAQGSSEERPIPIGRESQVPPILETVDPVVAPIIPEAA